MRPRFAISTSRRRTSGGNSLVEGAFTILPTFALIFAFVDFGLMFFRWETLQNAAREGVRYAVTFQTYTDPVTHVTSGQNASIEKVVQSNAMGLVKTTDSPPTISVNYYTQALPNTPGAGNVPGNIVEVHIQSPLYSWILPLSGSFAAGSAYRYSTPLRFNVYAYDILGGLPVGVTSVNQ